MAILDGRHALVTGGGRGIGRAIAKALSGAGAAVTVLGRQEATLKDTVSAGDAKGYVIADVTDEAAVHAVVKHAASARGPIDILVANAGTAKTAPFIKASPDLFREMFDQHVLGMVHPVQAVLASMIGRSFGRIVAVASIASLKAFPNTAPYTTAKHAMLGLVRSIALETTKTGVTANAVCPGYVETALIGGRIEQLVGRGMSREEAVGQFASRNNAGRLVQPEEVAEAVLYFCSPGAAATTGSTLVIGADAA
jgi:NAD(P)-dependent dehydrogenase (short-subunit alcohol dehydrogenase family)